MLAAIVIGFVFATSPHQKLFASTNRDPPLVTLHNLIGKRVEDTDGGEVGRLRDFLIDTNSGSVNYALLASGGFLGIHSRYKLVPARLLSTATAKRNVLAVRFTGAEWNRAPSLSASEAASLPADRARQIDDFYLSLQPAPRSTRQDIEKTSGPAPQQHTTSSQPARHRGTTSSPFRLASQLLGRTVANYQGEQFGEILDLLAELDGKTPAFAVVAGGRMFRDREYRYLVPLFALNLAGKEKAIVNASRATFDDARAFDQRQAKATDQHGGPLIYRYSEKNPAPANNTRQHSGNHHAAVVTPLDQSETTEDLAVTGRIRRALVNNDFLSLTAKNIKVITRSGRVTLCGAVVDNFERSQILHLAREAGGVEFIDDQLDIRSN